MKKVLVQTKSEMKATGLPKGAIIDYDNAPAFMQKKYDDIHDSEPSKECVKRNADYLITALKIREGIAKAHGTHAKCYTDTDRMVLNLMTASDYTGRMALPE